MVRPLVGVVGGKGCGVTPMWRLWCCVESIPRERPSRPVENFPTDGFLVGVAIGGRGGALGHCPVRVSKKRHCSPFLVLTFWFLLLHQLT